MKWAVGWVLAAFFAMNSAAADTRPQTFQESFIYPGDPVGPRNIRVTLMGSTPEPRLSQKGCSVYVELGDGETFVFDLGPGSMENYNAMGVPPSKMTKVFLTHLHVDHYSDLLYLYGMGPGEGRYEGLEIWGPAGSSPSLGTAAAITAMKAMTAWHRKSFSFIPIGNAYDLSVHEIPISQKANVIYDKNGVKITAFPALHTMDGALSYRLDWNGHSVVYSGDTSPNKYMIENAKDVDLLIHEVRAPVFGHMILQNGGMTAAGASAGDTNKVFTTFVHTDVNDLAHILSLTNPKMAVLNHLLVNADTASELGGRIRQEGYGGEIRVAQDLMVFDLTNSGVIQKMGLAPAQSYWGNFPTPANVPPGPETIDSLISPWLQDSSLKKHPQ